MEDLANAAGITKIWSMIILHLIRVVEVVMFPIYNYFAGLVIEVNQTVVFVKYMTIRLG
jgi:hypothetical protein